MDGCFELVFFFNVSANRSNTIVPVQWISLIPLPTVPHSIVGTQAAVCVFSWLPQSAQASAEKVAGSQLRQH
jgi:hypothetical protein